MPNEDAQPQIGARFTKAGEYYFSPRVWEFNLPAGHTCPFAKACMVKVDRETGKATKGDNIVFPCYAATSERYPGVRESRWRNYEALQGRSIREMKFILFDALPHGRAQAHSHPCLGRLLFARLLRRMAGPLLRPVTHPVLGFHKGSQVVDSATQCHPSESVLGGITWRHGRWARTRPQFAHPPGLPFMQSGPSWLAHRLGRPSSVEGRAIVRPHPSFRGREAAEGAKCDNKPHPFLERMLRMTDSLRQRSPNELQRPSEPQ